METKGTKSTSRSRPCKIWNQDRTVKKSLMATSLKDLVVQGKEKLGLVGGDDKEEVRIVLEEDGTEVEDEEYFQYKPDDTIYILLTANQKWRTTHRNEGTSDETDYSDLIGGEGEGQITEELTQLARPLKNNLGKLLAFSSEQLQKLVDANPITLAHILGETEEFVNMLQEKCQESLDDRFSTMEALEILRLYHEKRTNQSGQPSGAPQEESEDPSKRDRTKRRMPSRTKTTVTEKKSKIIGKVLVSKK